MPRSGYTICTSEQLPTSTTVSHGFIVEWYSSPPFGSHGPCKHSKPCPLDFGSGDPMQKTSAISHAAIWDDLPSPRHVVSMNSTIQLASSIDSLVRVSRRAESGTAGNRPSSTAFYAGLSLEDQQPSTVTTIRMVQSPMQPPDPKPWRATATNTSTDMPVSAHLILSHTPRSREGSQISCPNEGSIHAHC